MTAVLARERLGGVSLCVLVDGRRDAAECERLVEQLFEAGVRMIQLRDKQLTTPELVERARRAVAIARRRAPGEAIVFVAVAARHRRAAFEAADYMMDRLKTEAVFWKREEGAIDRWIEPTERDMDDVRRWAPIEE